MQRSAVALILVLCTTWSTVALGACLKVGVQHDVRTLNVFRATTVWSTRVLSLIYDATLYKYAPQTFEVIPWVADGFPEIRKEKGKTVAYVRLKPNYAFWEDSTPVTAYDVEFTGRLILKHKFPRFISDWEFVENVKALDRWTVKFVLKEERATFMHGTLMTPIVQKRQWERIESETRDPFNYFVGHPIGSGPFVLKRWSRGNYMLLAANPKWFKRGERVKGANKNITLGPYVDTILIKVYNNLDSAILALKRGDIDFLWWDITAGYIEQLRRNPNLKIVESPSGSIYYLGFNLRRFPFRDRAFRKAVAVLIDKEFIVDRVLKGYGVPLYSVVPPGYKAWHNPNVPKLGEGLSRSERVRIAKGILREAGYTWDEAGMLVAPNGMRLREIKIYTPPADYDPYRAMVGLLIAMWLRGVGIPATSVPMAFGTICEKVYGEHDFDMYILGFPCSIFPDYIRNLFHSCQDVKNGYNSSGYRNKEFDRIADEFVRALDPKRQRDLVFKMQEIIAEDLPYVPLYSKVLVQAHSTETRGWIQQLGGIGNFWSLVCVTRRLSGAWGPKRP